MKKIVIINGPNLDRLGTREPAIYGDQTLTDLENLLTQEAAFIGVDVKFYQSNHEGFMLAAVWQLNIDRFVFLVALSLYGGNAGIKALSSRSFLLTTTSAWASLMS